jgi:hypothetical protein
MDDPLNGPMAPATHSHSDTSASTNSTTAQLGTGDCHSRGTALPVHRRTHLGRRLGSLDAHLPITLPEVSGKRGVEKDLSVKTRAENLVREPAFIVAIILTGLILLGGFVVTKLSHTQHPRRRPRNCERMGSSANASSMRTTGTGMSPTSPLVQSYPQTPTAVQGEDQPYNTPDNKREDSPPSSGSPSTPTITPYSPAQALPIAGVVRPDVYIHEASSIPQIVLSQHHETFPQIEALAEADEIGDCPIARALEERAKTVADILLGVQVSSLHATHPASDSWSCLPEQASEASDHSTEDTAPVDLFSSSSTLSSHTSASGASSDPAELDDEQEVFDVETAFEVKRGHAQSMELVKGRLMSWGTPPVAAPLQDNLSISVEEGMNTEEQDHSKSCRGRSRPNSRIPIPALIITEPSTLSLFTAGSSTSNLSVDLSQFPVPPLQLDPAAFWQKLDEEINSSLALKQRRLI